MQQAGPFPDPYGDSEPEEAKDRMRPFSNGTEFMVFEESNCGRCWKSKPKNEKISSASHCDLLEGLTLAMFMDGTISTDHAARIGFKPGMIYAPPCSERQEKRPPRAPRTKRLAPGQAKLPMLDGEE